jgi:hypothetical protein
LVFEFVNPAIDQVDLDVINAHHFIQVPRKILLDGNAAQLRARDAKTRRFSAVGECKHLQENVFEVCFNLVFDLLFGEFVM